ncbi:hypothetical protein HDU76_013557 [Blyttiomyces sp. JEL0837]|nr:hypothetical protein HDU76_013557 [Blyttiomyces sp. JEL0837]
MAKILCLNDANFCAAAEDWSLMMYDFSVAQKTYSVAGTHVRNDDHTDIITSICAVRSLGLYLTSSRDRSIKVWDMYNMLIREIKFDSVIESLSIASIKGDILFGIGNRLDFIPFSAYLPPGYIKAVKSMAVDAEISEPAVPFDEDYDFFQNYRAKISLDDILMVDEKFEVHQERQRATKLDAKNDAIFRPGSFKSGWKSSPSHEQKDMNTLDLGDGKKSESDTKCDTVITARPESAEKFEQENADPASDSHMLTAESLNNSCLPLTSGGFSDICREIKSVSYADLPLLSEAGPFSPLPEYGGLSSTELLLEAKGEECERLSGIDLGGVLHEQLPIESEDSVNTPIVPEEVETVAPKTDVQVVVISQSPYARKSPTLTNAQHVMYIAPDGQIPNSILGRKVAHWKENHDGFQILKTLFPKKWGGKKKIDEEAKGVDNSKKGLSYRDKLRIMLEAKEREEREAAEAKERELAAEIDQEGYEEEDIESSSLDISGRSRIPRHEYHFKALAPVKKVEKYPLIIQQAMAYSWFPLDQIFHAQDQSDKDAMVPKHLKVEAKSEVILPIVIDCFKSLATTSASQKIEMIEFMSWLLEEFGLNDNTNIIRSFCRCVQNFIYADKDDVEVETLMDKILDMIVKYGTLQMELIPTLLMLTGSPLPKLRQRGIQGLSSIGATRADSKHAINILSEFYNSVCKELYPSAAQNTNTLEYRNQIMSFLRKNLRKYLIKSSKDPIMTKKLKDLNEFGLINRNKKEGDVDEDDEEEEAGKDLIPRMDFVPLPTKNKSSRRGSVAVSALGGSRRPTLLGNQIQRRTSMNPSMSPSIKTSLAVKEEVNSGKEARRKSVAFQILEENEETRAATAEAVVEEKIAPEQAEPVPRISTTDRSPTLILQNPSFQDFVAVLNFYVKNIEDKLAREESLRLAKIARESTEAEEARREHERQLALIEFMKKKDAERERRTQERKERIRDLHAKRQTEPLPKIKKSGPRELFTGSFPPLSATMSGRSATGLQMHMLKMNKSMPVENINLIPFLETDTSPKSRPRTAQSDAIEDAAQESDYRTYRTGRKYCVFSFAEPEPEPEPKK